MRLARKHMATSLPLHQCCLLCPTVLEKTCRYRASSADFFHQHLAYTCSEYHIKPFSSAHTATATDLKRSFAQRTYRERRSESYPWKEKHSLHKFYFSIQEIPSNFPTLGLERAITEGCLVIFVFKYYTLEIN